MSKTEGELISVIEKDVTKISGDNSEQSILKIEDTLEQELNKNNIIEEDEKIIISNQDGADKTSYKKFSGEQCMVKKTDGEWRKFV